MAVTNYCYYFVIIKNILKSSPAWYRPIIYRYSLMMSVIDWHIIDKVVLAKIKYIVKLVLFILFLGKTLVRFVSRWQAKFLVK